MNLRGATLLFLSSLCLSSCKEDPILIPELNVGARKVLVEELSGVRCQNCPDGARLLASLQGQYKDNLIVVTMHADLFGTLVKPYTQNDPKPTKDDFRTQDAIDLTNFVGVPLGIPAAAVNRRQIPNEESPFVIAISQWSGLIGQQLQLPPQVGVFISQDYDEQSRRLDIDVNITPDVDLAGEHRLTVMITQDSIIDVQKDGLVTVENYVHRHVLRDIVTRPDGDPIAEPLTARALITKKFSLNLPEKWDAKHCSIVAFVHRNGTPDKEVLQAAEKHVGE
jgi:hypothetical protein